MKDILGKAILDYFNDNFSEDIFTETSISEEDTLPILYLFRSFDEMPPLEQTALKHAYGKVLDIGCGAGSHSLYLQKKNADVTAIDISEGAIKTSKLRGVKKAFQQDVFQLKDQKFDTILLLMNGTGIFGKYKEVPKKLLHLKSLLNQEGQILIDSSDIIYMFDEDEDGGKWIPMDGDYYGELTYTLKYKGERETTTWLYLDFTTLQTFCQMAGLKCELLAEGEHYNYLAKITL
ncbi:class I SAM-dependent methyltransferase [Galbibacter pacificus]|uniref:Class I SAM-dependent methyltransferase n=1 Tax=Galbibacter pacificus TaxID=2996052 RepID=A0ABT6FMX0_9FLAO|nr:class I SAM-dependent methyltransferase [Galbibacter pacificus]MDG3580958.1 class I SAM-dependent methyltransferase [Galbibacter pacificus]MDG3584436.1 class I SAM-dependent methyltransferase [Galbibacter pacificus]